MKVFLLTLLQSILTVAGMGMLHDAVQGKQLRVDVLLTALLSWNGLLSMLMLVCGFVLTTLTLSFARLSIVLPLNTGLVFVCTILHAILWHQERVEAPVIAGMSLIVIGVAVVAHYR